MSCAMSCAVTCATIHSLCDPNRRSVAIRTTDTDTDVDPRSDVSPGPHHANPMKHLHLLPAALLLAACGNTVTNNGAMDGVVSGPPIGSKVSVSFQESETTTTMVEGRLVGIGVHWIGVERAPGAISWMPADRVKFILEDQESGS